MYCRTSGKEFVMFRRVDALLLLAAFLVIAAVVCFLPSNNFLPAWAYLCGPLFWFFGTVIAIVWMVCRFFPSSPAGSEQPTASSSGQMSAGRRNIRRAGLLIFAGILPLLLCLTTEAALSPTGSDVFKSKCQVSRPDGTGEVSIKRSSGPLKRRANSAWPYSR
jgi:hypothetical protein